MARTLPSPLAQSPAAANPADAAALASLVVAVLSANFEEATGDSSPPT